MVRDRFYTVSPKKGENTSLSGLGTELLKQLTANPEGVERTRSETQEAGLPSASFLLLPSAFPLDTLYCVNSSFQPTNFLNFLDLFSMLVSPSKARKVA